MLLDFPQVRRLRVRGSLRVSDNRVAAVFYSFLLLRRGDSYIPTGGFLMLRLVLYVQCPDSYSLEVKNV